MSIRLRLAAWCAAIFSLLFVGLAVLIFSVHARSHYRDVDDTLAAVTTHYRSEIEQELASGTPLTPRLAASIDVEGQQLVGAELTVYDAAGGVIRGRPLPGAAPSTTPGEPSPHASATFMTVDTPDGRVRIHTMPLTDGARTAGYAQASVSLAKLDRSISRYRLLVIAAAVGGLIVAVAGSLATAARAFRPVASSILAMSSAESDGACPAGVATASHVTASRAPKRRINRMPLPPEHESAITPLQCLAPTPPDARRWAVS